MRHMAPLSALWRLSSVPGRGPASLVPFTCAMALALGAGCATTDGAQTTSPSPATPTATTTTTSQDPEVVLLRERVTRLERRLAEMDGTVAALVARNDPGAPAGAPSAHVAAPSPKSQWQPLPRVQPTTARDPLAAIELSRPGSASADSLAVVDDLGALPPAETARYDQRDDGDSHDLGTIEGPADDGDGDAVVLRMHGDQVDVSTPDPLQQLGSARALYAYGQARLKEGRHLEAITAFEDILDRHASSDLADNAQYWIGFCHQARGDHHLALDVWSKLPARFPRSAKVPDALYGMAVSREALGEPALAEVLYDELVASYPKAEKRPDAKKALRRLRP